MAASGSKSGARQFADNHSGRFQIQYPGARSSFQNLDQCPISETTFWPAPGPAYTTEKLCPPPGKDRLLAMVRGGGPMFGKNLRRHSPPITAPGKPGTKSVTAWDAKSKKHNSGWAKRHYMESALFGLYDSQSQRFARTKPKTIFHLRLHRPLILEREASYGGMVAKETTTTVPLSPQWGDYPVAGANPRPGKIRPHPGGCGKTTPTSAILISIKRVIGSGTNRSSNSNVQYPSAIRLHPGRQVLDPRTKLKSPATTLLIGEAAPTN